MAVVRIPVGVFGIPAERIYLFFGCDVRACLCSACANMPLKKAELHRLIQQGRVLFVLC